MTVEDPRSDSWDVASRTGGAALGFLVGLAFAGPLGAGAGTAIGTIASPVLEAWISHCIAEFQEYGRELATGAADAAQTSEDEIVQRILETRPFNHSLGKSWTLPHELPPRGNFVPSARFSAKPPRVVRGASTKTY